MLPYWSPWIRPLWSVLGGPDIYANCTFNAFTVTTPLINYRPWDDQKQAISSGHCHEKGPNTNFSVRAIEM